MTVRTPSPRPSARRLLEATLLMLGASAAMLLLSAGPAAAAAVSGPCTGSADLSGPDTSARVTHASTGRVTIPREASVAYQGTIRIPKAEDMPYQGDVSLDVAPGLDLIPGLDDPTVASWSWGGGDKTTDKISKAGNTSYDLDLPADLLGGVKATATGQHTQAGKTCKLKLDIEIGGSAVNVASLGSAAATGASAAGLGWAARGKKP